MSARWVLLGLMVAPLVLFLPLLIQNSLIFGWDSTGEFDFWRTWTYDWIGKGVLPWHNPNLLGGYPLLLDPQQAPFYPPNLVHLWLPFHQAQNLLALTHCFWAGVGVYLASRILGAVRFSAFLAAVCWQTFNLYIGQLLLGTWPEFLTLSWCGFAVWATELLLLRPAMKSAALLALCLGTAFYAGHTQYALYLTYGCAFYGMTRLLADPSIRRKALGKSLMAAFLLLAGLMAVQAAGAWHLKSLSTRTGGLPVIADNTSITAFNVLSLFMPTVFGEEGHRYYWGLGFQNLWMPFIGIYWVWLWLSQGRQALRHPSTAAAAMAMLLCLTLSIGFPHLGAVMGFLELPGLSLMRQPVRWTAIAMVFALAGGAALWTKTTPLGGVSPRLSRIWFVFPLGVMGLGLALAAFPGLAPKVLDFWLAKGAFNSLSNIYPDYPQELLQQMPWDLLTASSACLLSMVLTLLFLKGHIPNARLGLGALMVGPSLFLASRMILPVAPETFHFSPRLVGAIQAEIQTSPGAGRVATVTPTLAEPLPPWIRTNYWWNNRYSQWDQHAGMTHHLANIGGYVSLPPRDYLNLVIGKDPQTKATGEFDWNFARNIWTLDLLGVSVVLQKAAPKDFTQQPDWCDDSIYNTLNQDYHPAGRTFDPYVFCDGTPGETLDALTPVAEVDGYEILKNPHPQPFAFPVRYLEIGKDFTPGPGQRETVWLEKDPDVPRDQGILDSHEVAIKKNGSNPNEFSLEALTYKPRVVVLSLPYDSAWEVTLNHRPAPLLRADGALSAVVNPGGQRTFQFRYVPPYMDIAMPVSVGALLLCLWFLGFTPPGVRPGLKAVRAA